MISLITKVRDFIYKNANLHYKGLEAEVGDIIDNKIVLENKSILDETGYWQRLTTQTVWGNKKLYGIWVNSDGSITKREHRE